MKMAVVVGFYSVSMGDVVRNMQNENGGMWRDILPSFSHSPPDMKTTLFCGTAVLSLFWHAVDGKVSKYNKDWAISRMPDTPHLQTYLTGKEIHVG